MLALLFALAVHEADFIVHDFRFASGETIPALRLHYRTIGDAKNPAVLVLHGTTGSGAQFLGQTFAGELFGQGQLLDADKHFIILPDGIGHGGSSKPSDGAGARFPHYSYADMVEAQHRLVSEALHVTHLRLIIGTSMGCMHSWMWMEAHPRFMDAALPLACLPVQISGRNRVMRRMIIDALRADARAGLKNALDVLFIMTSAPLVWQKAAPTRDAADDFYEDWLRKRLASMDGNDVLYAFDASRDYDPQPRLGEIQATVTAINSADDVINPPELGILEAEVRKVPRAQALVLPISSHTRGHGTHTLASVWKDHLANLLSKAPVTGQ